LNIFLRDVGGHDKIRPLWQHYFMYTVAVIWVVDSTDKERLPVLAKEILKANDHSDLMNVVYLVRLCSLHPNSFDLTLRV